MSDQSNPQTGTKIMAAPLPKTISEWQDLRKDLIRNINNEVNNIHVELISDEAYLMLLEAVFDSESREGSLSIDDMLAARRIREYAQEHKLTFVANKPLKAIILALRVVLRRYGLDRKTRRALVNGEHVPGGDNGNSGE